MSNELKRVQERLWKKSESVELSAEKVELGLVDDIAKVTQSLISTGKELNDAVANADRLKKDLDLEVAKIKKLYPQVSKLQDAEDKIWDKATKQAADLGLDRSSIKGWKEFSDAGVNANSSINAANKYMS